MDDLFESNSSDSKSVDYTELAHKLFYRARVLLRRFWWILPLAIAMGVTYKAVEGYFSEPYYESTSEMIVNGRIALPENDVYSEERDNFFGTQIELMSSDLVRARAFERVRLTHPDIHQAYVDTPAYAEWGSKSVSFSADIKEETNIFELSAETPHPEFTQLYLNAMMEEFISRRSEMRAKTSEKTFDILMSEAEALEAEIDAGEDAIVDFQKNNNIVFIQEQGSSAGAYLSELKRRLAELKTESRALEGIVDADAVDGLLMDQMQSADEGALKNTVIAAVGTAEDNQTYLTSSEQLDIYRAQLEEFSIYLRPKHPKIINLKSEIERTENQLVILRRQALERIRERKQVVESRIVNLNQEIEIWEATALENGQLMAEFERLQSRLARSKINYENNQSSLRQIDQNQNLQLETISVLQEARSPRISGSSMKQRFIQGTLYGIVLSGGILFLIGAMDNRILSASDLGSHFEEPLLGAIPFEKTAEGDEESMLLEKGDSRYVFAEACRNLRTSVFFLGKDGFRPSTFAITSAVPNEGKSTLSANLSIALSFSRSKVLLVDTDLRRGRLHKLFKLKPEKGLADVLEGDATLDQAIQKTSYEYLDFISIGDYPEQPGELLLSDRMEQLIEEAKSKYDFVVFDTAPILATDDTSGFAGKVDSLLFTIRCSFTQIRQIKPAMSRIRERGVKISGLILNRVDVSQPGYHYYRYSEYYSDSKSKRTEKEKKVATSSAS
ncbi:MAG: polysaccharide biosynthesis tyrosine autokinase [Verrucomicrobiota bacterium]